MISAARLAEKAGRVGLATNLYNRSTAGSVRQRAEALYRLANLESQKGDPSDVCRLLEEAVELQPGHASWHYRLATVLEKQGENEKALTHYRIASELDPANETWKQRLERCENALRMAKAKTDDERAKKLRREGARWQELEVLLSATPNFSKSPDWFLRLGDSLETMNRFGEAAEAFSKANDLRPRRPENLAREGYCWKIAGFPERAKVAFERAVKHDDEYQSKILGVGVFLERRGMWHEAAAQYELDCEDRPMDAELQFRAGRALERSYRWKEAVHRYQQATLLDRSDARNHFRLGYAYERMDDFSAAEDCYAYGIDLLPTAAKYWSYRLGVVREAQGRLEEAVEAYAASLNVAVIVREPDENPVPSVSKRRDYELTLLDKAKNLALRSPDPEHLLSLASEFELRELWQDAVVCLEAAADRQQSFTPAVYYRLGTAYAQSGDLEASSNAFRMTRISVAPRGIDNNRYKKDATLQKYFEYAEMMENLPIRNDVILYESFLGKQITCNPYALFQKIYNDPKYAGFTHVWSITPGTHIPVWMKHLENVVFAQRGSHLYRRYLATAGFLINNVTFQSFFVRREGQKYLNTWHGTPMKTLGKDIGTGVLEHRNVARNFLQSTHILTPNEHTTHVLLDRYDVDTLATAKIGYTGYPRVDLTLGMDEIRKTEILRDLGVEAGDRRKVVLYAPTWRGGAAFQHFDTERLTADLQALSELDCVVLFQGHHLSVALLPDTLPVRVVADEIDTNELLAVVDILITDYSSILFDFLPTKRPVICYTYDLDEYVAERGLYFTPGEMGLVEARTGSALIDAVQAALSDPEAWAPPSALTTKFCGREDGDATSRAMSFFLEEDHLSDVSRQKTKKQRFLFHHSMIPNGISSSLTNLLRSLDPENYDITVVVPAGVIEKSDGGVGVLRGLPDYVKVVADAGRQVVNIEEKWLVDYFNRWNFLPSAPQRQMYMGAFEREYRRLFGDAEFDVIVEFEGYSRYWTSVLAAAPGDAKKIIYLHNDMKSEHEVRFPYLRSIFALYDNFDVLASVSPALSELNKSGVGKMIPGSLSKFVPVINQIDPDGVQQKSSEPLDTDLVPWFSGEHPTFVTMGRLSMEKDQAKLLRSFAQVIGEGYRANLILLGEGPLRQDLEQLVEDLNLVERVYFAGLRENPFPALRAAGCFVLPSNHEGQPMVLLESMILGTPILATDIPGSRQVLSENLECIVENSVDGLAEGIRQVLDGKQESSLHFDAKAYCESARSAFLEMAGL
ncbi:MULTISPECIES: CDP-glycerol glycerophosphotransferase family protein [unclassified Arthrobacter]|uniref:CDP-glycerol glycerophosphotransferase family protein n=1 Tax=unclassified Arthrobacter TaxID=235627 RepID=UPI0015E20549|nr:MULTISPECIES: CDP-glycerol glycerophosphotransferase family protein [unclassified Arthrobacter]